MLLAHGTFTNEELQVIQNKLVTVILAVKPLAFPLRSSARPSFHIQLKMFWDFYMEMLQAAFRIIL